MSPLDLTQAVQQPNVPGALQQMLLSRVHSPEQSQMLEQQRQQALSSYQDALRQPAYGNYTPTEASLYTWIANMPHPDAVYRGIAAGGQQLANQETARVKGDIAAAKVGYEDATGLDKLDTQELAALRSMAGRSGTGPTVKMDKDGNMVVYDPSTGESRVVHSSQGEAYQRIWAKAYQAATDEGMPNPEEYAHITASKVLGKSPSAAIPIQKAEPPKPATTSPEEPVTDSSIVYKDKPEASRRETYLKGDEEASIKDYRENVIPAAQQAENTLNNISVLRQIPRDQGAFAGYKARLGSVLGAMGFDNSLVRQAQSVEEIRPILAKVANDRLLLAKGVQTEGDAQRAFDEFIKITDTQKAVDFMYAWASELSQRSKMRKAVYDLSADEKNSRRFGPQYWDRTDYAKAAPVAFLNGRPWTFTDWRNKFIKLNPDAPTSAVIKEWNKLARREDGNE